MRRPHFSLAAASLAAVSCTTTALAPQPGIGGQALRGVLDVHVARELDDTPIAGASVDVGGAAVTTDANGDATLATLAPSVTLRVSAPGFTTEQWIGVDHDQARVELVPPLPARTVMGTISGGNGDLVVGAETALTMLRTSSPLASTGACPGGACDVALTVEVSGSQLDVVLVDASSARLAAGVPVDAGDRFAIDAASLGSSARMGTVHVTVPSAPGLEAVVGIPGIATPGGVALLPALVPTAITTQAPVLEGPLAGDRLWYVAYASNADASGVSMIFDRDVGDRVVRLPSAFLAIPVATASGTVGIDVDPEVELYVIEAFAGESATRTLVLRPSGAHLDVPISLAGASRVVVRAVDTVRQSDTIGLVSAEVYATRIATLTL